MSNHRLRIEQIVEVKRSIVVEIEATSVEEAVEKQQNEAAPSLEDPGWVIDENCLISEKVVPV